MPEKELKRLMSSLLELKPEEINDETSNDNTESWDSLKHMEIISTIEDNFNITFSADEIIELTSFKKIKAILKEKGA